MAYAPDGLIEGYYDPRETFLAGVQFHPERMPEGKIGNGRLWKGFAAAVRALP